jgi:hypothetical protein
MNFASNTDIQEENRIPFSVYVLYLISRGDVTQSDIYKLWAEYWCEEEEGNFVFPMSDIAFQLEQYSKTEIVRMLSNSKFNLKDEWGCIYWDDEEHLTSHNFLPVWIDMEEMMKWVDRRTDNQTLCSPVLYSSWVEWKKGGDMND